KNALDVALWLESDRMGHFVGAIDQDKLDKQRGVVQNEKRQGENRPYGIVWELMTKGTAPPGHPYSWTVIGSMEDLNAASLDHVADVLVSGKTGLLYKRLVYDEQIATDVSAYVDAREISGQFGIVATAKPGGDLAKIEKAIDEEVARFLAKGPTREELERVK